MEEYRDLEITVAAFTRAVILKRRPDYDRKKII